MGGGLAVRSVHDNYVYAYAVLCEEQRIVLYTHYRDGEANEFTDLIFTGVVAHLLEGGHDSNILLDVGEVPLEALVLQNAELFEREKKYGWPRIEYEGLDDLLRILREQGVRAYGVKSAYGLGGWVLAMRMEQVERETRWRAE